MLGNFSCFCCCLLIFFQNKLFQKNSFKNAIRLSNGLYPDQHRCSFGPELGPNCLRQNLQLATKELSIEMQNFSFMMKITRLLFLLIGDIKMALFSSYLQAKNLNFNSYIYIVYH